MEQPLRIFAEPFPPSVPETPNLFRLLKREPPDLTTVVAIECADSLVMGSDLQRSGTFREWAPKIKPIRQTELLGCAGRSAYIGVFRRHVRTALTAEARPDYEERLNEAIGTYSTYLWSKIEREGLRQIYGLPALADLWPEGILGVYDQSESRYRIFQFNAPEPCIEAELAPRAAVGSGGDAATVLMKMTEGFLTQAGIELGWKRFHQKTMRQFIEILLRRVSEIDPYTLGLDIQVLTPQGSEGINQANPVFPEYGKPYKSNLAELIANAFGELSRQMPAFMADRYGLLPVLEKIGLKFDPELRLD